jgi:UDP-N-acetylmuramoyl-tripeptide--D-alanyl-D-alanine ligase
VKRLAAAGLALGVVLVALVASQSALTAPAGRAGKNPVRLENLHRGSRAWRVRLVRPHVAIITTIASAHIEYLGSMEAIADAKAEIFEGLEPEGVAIIPEDSPHRDRLVKAARKLAGRTITFGHGEADITALHAVRSDNGGSLVTARLMESELTYTIAQRGDHWVMNSMAVLAAIEAVGADLAIAGLALADMGGLKAAAGATGCRSMAAITC